MSSFAETSTSRPKSATFTIRGSGKIEFSSVMQSEQHFSTLKTGDSRTPFVYTLKKAGTTRGGIIAQEDFAGISACGLITSGCPSRWQNATPRRGSIKRRERGSARQI